MEYKSITYPQDNGLFMMEKKLMAQKLLIERIGGAGIEPHGLVKAG